MRCATVHELPPLLQAHVADRVVGDRGDVLLDYDSASGAIRWWRLDGAGGKGRILVPADLMPDVEAIWGDETRDLNVVK